MFDRFKINTAAALVCLAFVFRIFVVNVILLLPVDLSETDKLSTKYTPPFSNRNHTTEVAVRKDVSTYAIVEVCAEVSDNEEDPIKEISPILLPFLNPLLKKDLVTSAPSHTAGAINFSLSSRKYLELSILRI